MFQEKALSILKSGKNVFLTGSAGTGKTYLAVAAAVDALLNEKVNRLVLLSSNIDRYKKYLKLITFMKK